VFDLGLIIVTHLLATWAYKQSWRPEWTNATILALLLFSIAGSLWGLYRPWRSERLIVELRTVILSWLTTAGVLVFAAFATKTSVQYSRVVSFGWFVGAPVVMCAWRLLLRMILRTMRAKGLNIRTVAIYGATPSGRGLFAQIDQRPWMGMRVIGVYDDRGPERREPFGSDSVYAGTGADLIAACRAGKINVVYIALPLRAEPRIAHVLKALADTTATVYLVADFFTYDLLCARWSAIGSVPLISLHDTPFRGVNGWLKRMEDIVIGSIIVLIIALPLLVIGLLVKLTSKGPIFFRQRRYGLNGREIRVLKFRSMTVLEDGPTVVQAKKDDQRVTPLGKILRRTSLDELPQFLQVLTGEMSIVGPRPHAVAHNEQYRALIQGYMLRHKVKPGITGWAQVNGWRGETPDVSWMEKRVQHDLEYIEKWSLAWDIKIILLTMAGRKANRNAY
jgi:putative colanic acid biosynthesis UDP-glucose lipid carrier transferase